MTNSCSINDSLTFEEMEGLDTLLYQLEVNIKQEGLEAPSKPLVGAGGIDLLTAEQFGMVKLSGATRKAEERRLLREHNKKLGRRNRKPYKLGRGKVHHKTMLATKNKNRLAKWRDTPFSCYITGYGCYNVSKDVWDRYIMPYWEMYDPKDIKLVRIKKAPDGTWYGTRQKPYDIYSFNLVHKKDGIIYNGQDRMLYDMSDNTYDTVQGMYTKDDSSTDRERLAVNTVQVEDSV